MMYRFELVCPVCGKQAETIGDKCVPPPIINCGNCRVAMKVRSAEVLPHVSALIGLDLTHKI